MAEVVVLPSGEGAINLPNEYLVEQKELFSCLAKLAVAGLTTRVYRNYLTFPNIPVNQSERQQYNPGVSYSGMPFTNWCAVVYSQSGLYGPAAPIFVKEAVGLGAFPIDAVQEVLYAYQLKMAYVA